MAWRLTISGVDREWIDENLPILEFYLADVLRHHEATRTAAARKVSRERLLKTFLRTRDVPLTARLTGVSPSTVRQIVSRSIWIAMRIAGLWPPASGDT